MMLTWMFACSGSSSCRFVRAQLKTFERLLQYVRRSVGLSKGNLVPKLESPDFLRMTYEVCDIIKGSW